MEKPGAAAHTADIETDETEVHVSHYRSFRRASTSLAVLLTSFVCTSVVRGQAPAPEETVRLLRSDSRAPYVHRLTLYDAAGKAIDPADPEAPPYSPKATCTKCHAYGEISCGWHFNAALPEIDHGRPGEPWVYIDVRTGTQLPLSHRGWPGTYRPADVGMSDFQFIQYFGRHLTGGGIGEPDQKAIDASPQAKRWQISGPLEIDCMVCHSADQSHDPAELARQIEAQNFRWAATAALGLATIRGEARGVSNDYDPEAPPSQDRRDLTLPKTEYLKSKFDGDNRYLFNIVRDPPAERCYHCHSERSVGPGAAAAWEVAGDVHIASGLSCSDCHSHGIRHDMVRGYEGEPAAGRSDAVHALTCSGCHLGNESEGNRDEAMGQSGRGGAPHPHHVGIPPLHFEKLTCTACHSGPWPEHHTKNVQTSMAHGLGVASKDRREDALPLIVSPVFARDERQRIAPQRLLWPAFFGLHSGDRVQPLALDSVQKAADKVLGKRKPKADAAPIPLTDEQIGQLLEALKPKDESAGAPTYVRDGVAYRLKPAGGIETFAHRAADAYRWAVAHDVRPAQQSLGVRGCDDCHAADSPIVFGHVAARPFREGVATSQPGRRMHDLHGYSPALATAWANSFDLRSEFKWAAIVACGVIALALLRRVTLCCVSLPQTAEAAPRRAVRPWWSLIAMIAVIGGVLIEALTSFAVEWTGGRVAGWPLYWHLLAAPLLIGGLALLAIIWGWFIAARSIWEDGVIAGVLLIGLVVTGSMVAAMFPVFGYNSQRALLRAHEISALVLMIAMLPLVIISLSARRVKK